jgi:hypothetical protein
MKIAEMDVSHERRNHHLARLAAEDSFLSPQVPALHQR